ncbi:hypothetical protein ACLKA6_013617 [Drosophila palustris]
MVQLPSQPTALHMAQLLARLKAAKRKAPVPPVRPLTPTTIVISDDEEPVRARYDPVVLREVPMTPGRGLALAERPQAEGRTGQNPGVQRVPKVTDIHQSMPFEAIRGARRNSVAARGEAVGTEPESQEAAGTRGMEWRHPVQAEGRTGQNPGVQRVPKVTLLVFVNSFVPDPSRDRITELPLLHQAELKCRLEILEAYFKQAISVQTQIEKECETDTGRVDLEDLYIDIKVCIKEQLIEEIHESTFAATLATRPPSGKLPKPALPTFAGNCADYKNFITLFNQLVDQQDSLSNIEKYNQLLSCLSGAALETVKRFQVTSENYRLALDRLKERYDNPTLVFLNNVSALFKLKNVTKSNCQEIRSLVDNATALYNSLTSLGSEAQIAQAMLIAIVMEKVDPETKREWNKSLDYSTLPTWKLCMQVVAGHCQYLESIEHRVIRCNQFKDMTVTERYEAAKRLSLCLNCLGKGHLAAKCPSNQRCRTCSRLHHTLLHRETSEVRPSPSSSTSQMTTLPSDVVTHTHTNNTSDQVILATAIVQVRDASGNYRIGRALLDSCSQVNFISERFAQSLRLPMVKRHMRICSIGESHTQIKFGTSATIKSRLDKFEMPIDFCKTLLGWIVSGRYEGSRRQVHSYSLSLEESINENLERLWRIDDLQKSIDKFTRNIVSANKRLSKLFISNQTGELLSGSHLRTIQASWDLHQPLRTYELNTVTYGTATAPYLAIRSMTHLADLHMKTKGIGAQAIKSSFYVDDFLCGHNTAEGLRQLKEEVTEILGKGKFQLAKWHSNHPDFVDDNTIKDLNLMDDSVTSALGLTWNQREDVLLFAFRPKRSFNEVTKRTILSLASSLFDPLGLVAPVIVTAKIILQELWILKLHWDESVPQALCQAWKSFAASLPALESLTIPRFCLQSNNEELQLHGFCDASIRAYGCCIYARTISSNGKIRVRLVTSNCRVAPTRKLSLPKLELAAAHLLAQLYVKIKGIFVMKHTTYLWSDSQIVLHWIQQHSATLSTFVGNRVSDIQESTLDCHWRHVPTQHNPADLVSRGCPPGELVDSIWFLGPEYLSQSPSAWPKNKRSEPDLEVVALEKRKSAFKATTIGSYLLESIRSISLIVFPCVLWLG